MSPEDKSGMKWKDDGAQNPLVGNAALWDAALDELSARSFGEASLNDIIRKAGLNKGSFYYRFYDKLDLYLSLFYRIGEQKLALFRRYDDSNPTDDFFDSIRKKAVIGIRFAREDPRYNALSRRFLTEDTDFRQKVYGAFGHVTENALLGMVEDAQRKGQIRTDVPARMMAEVFEVLLDRIDKVVTPDMEEPLILEKVDELIRVLRDGTAGGDAG